MDNHHLGSCCRSPRSARHVLWVRRRGTCLQALDQILRQRLWSVNAATPAAGSHARAYLAGGYSWLQSTYDLPEASLRNVHDDLSKRTLQINT
jgi:hypothetical protein